jgi:hypothetical protein
MFQRRRWREVTRYLERQASGMFLAKSMLNRSSLMWLNTELLSPATVTFAVHPARKAKALFVQASAASVRRWSGGTAVAAEVEDLTRQVAVAIQTKGLLDSDRSHGAERRIDRPGQSV